MEISKHSLGTCKKPGFREFEIRPDWVKFKNFFVLVISLFNTKLILSKLNIGLKVKKNPYFFKDFFDSRDGTKNDIKLN